MRAALAAGGSVILRRRGTEHNGRITEWAGDHPNVSASCGSTALILSLVSANDVGNSRSFVCCRCAGVLAVLQDLLADVPFAVRDRSFHSRWAVATALMGAAGLARGTAVRAPAIADVMWRKHAAGADSLGLRPGPIATNHSCVVSCEKRRSHHVSISTQSRPSTARPAIPLSPTIEVGDFRHFVKVREIANIRFRKARRF
jgi:hypothetical protein